MVSIVCDVIFGIDSAVFKLPLNSSHCNRNLVYVAYLTLRRQFEINLSFRLR